jgi:hypothetical protein
MSGKENGKLEIEKNLRGIGKEKEESGRKRKWRIEN